MESSSSSSGIVVPPSAPTAAAPSSWPPIPRTGPLRMTPAHVQHMGLAALFPPSALDTNRDQRANGLTFSENGRWLYSSHNDGVINLIGGDSGTKEGELYVRETGFVRLAVCVGPVVLLLVHPSSPQYPPPPLPSLPRSCRLITETHHESCVLHAAASPVGHPSSVAYHNLHENKVVRYFRGHTNKVTSISLAPDADTVLTTGLDGKFLVWDLRSPVPCAAGEFAPAESPAYNVEPPHAVGAFNGTGQVMAIAVPQRGLAFYDATMMRAEPSEFLGAKAPFTSTPSTAPLLQYTTDPKLLPGMSPDALPPPFPATISFVDLHFSPDDRLIALATLDRGVLIVDAFVGTQEVALLAAHPHDVAHPSSISWSPDSRFVAVGGCDGHVYVYDLSDPPGVLGPTDEHPDGPKEPFRWRPGYWEPPVSILGEAHKGATAAAAAREAAAKHTADALAKMHQSRRTFAATKGIPIASVGPPTLIKPTPVPIASSPEEMASRMDGPVSCVRWHPNRAVLGSAGRSVALWTLPAAMG
jgi:WD40 repeat protein